MNLSEAIDINDYTAIRQKTTLQGELISDEYYCEGAWVILRLLKDFGKQSSFDFNKDGKVGTVDLMGLLTGYGGNAFELPDLSWFNTGQIFGEGNEWLTSNHPDLAFGWLHRTPFDEIFVSYNGYALNSFILDVVQTDNTITEYTFIKRGQLYNQIEK